MDARRRSARSTCSLGVAVLFFVWTVFRQPCRPSRAASPSRLGVSQRSHVHVVRCVLLSSDVRRCGTCSEPVSGGAPPFFSLLDSVVVSPLTRPRRKLLLFSCQYAVKKQAVVHAAANPRLTAVAVNVGPVPEQHHRRVPLLAVVEQLGEPVRAPSASRLLLQPFDHFISWTILSD